MPSRQQWILPPPKPLEDRLGRDFFRDIPSLPGIYFMRDAAENTVYVGQSKNLRQRLSSYKNAHPNHTPKRTWRLVQCVRAIEWEILPSANAAIQREEELIRSLKPRFNRANIYPEGYRYVSIEISEDRVTLEESRNAEPNNLVFGAFKGTHRSALSALARLFFRIQTGRPNWWDIPLHWGRLCRRVALHFPQRATVQSAICPGDIVSFFAGESNTLLDQLLNQSATLPLRSAFDENWILEDLSILDSFYHHGPARNNALASNLSRESSLIEATELNALILRSRARNVA